MRVGLLLIPPQPQQSVVVPSGVIEDKKKVPYSSSQLHERCSCCAGQRQVQTGQLDETAYKAGIVLSVAEDGGCWLAVAKRGGW